MSAYLHTMNLVRLQGSIFTNPNLWVEALGRGFGFGRWPSPRGFRGTEFRVWIWSITFSRRNVPLLSHLTRHSSQIQIMACFIISVGGLLYSWNDQHFHLEGYTWGILYSASMVFNSLYVKHAFNQHNELNGDPGPPTLNPRVLLGVKHAKILTRNKNRGVGQGLPQRKQRHLSLKSQFHSLWDKTLHNSVSGS